ncbi:response regulator [Candidatus Saccharibacteria bacterium]|nr:response regulator [Candidatus Saccharibacteria bacterium]
MAKVMLVEDDNNLRQIYEDRLAAEGYTVITAPDGEAALALAVKERPDLIIADIMMPKVSGFDMLDILRSTPETRDTKIIMMTALSQAEDKTRAEKLGADKYLVKSQVTLEDVVKVAADMLNEQKAGTDAAVASMTNAPTPPQPTDSTAPAATPGVQPVQAPIEPVAPPPEPSSPAPSPEPPVTPEPTSAPAPDPTPVSEPAVTPAPAQDTTSDDTPTVTDAPAPSTVPVVEPPKATPTEDTTVTDTDSKPTVTSIPITTPDEPEDKVDDAPVSAPVPALEEKPFSPEPSKGENVISPDVASTEQHDEEVADAQSEPEATEKKAVEKEIEEDVVADNPTLTTSAEPEEPTKPEEPSATDMPTPVEPGSTEPVKDGTTDDTSKSATDETNDSAQKMAHAFGDLVKSTESDSTTEAPENKPATTDETKPAKPSTGYIAADDSSDDKPTLSMTHERKIEPTSDVQSNAPDIHELLAKEMDTSDPTPPPINAVIQPGGGSITGASSSSEQAPAQDDPNKIAL